MNVLPLVISVVAGFTGAGFMSRYAYRFGLLDIPNDRSSHNLPTPRGGGLGILAAFIVTSIWLKLSLLIWLPAALLSLVSFFDDRLDLSPWTRLIFQFGAALFVVGYTVWPPEGFLVQNPSFIIQNLLLLALCSIFIAGTANFYNFMDGINGIAGITGTVAFALLGIFAYSTNQLPMAISSWCMSAACIGFLPLNVPRARVFMGDVGSILLGFVFAAYVVLLAKNAADFVLLAGFLSTFYVDALTTLYVRKRSGERLSQAHRRHLYQLLANQGGVAHWKVSACYGAVQAAVGILLLWIWPFGLGPLIIAELLLVAMWMTVMVKVRKAVER